ncbi:DIBOA-glucoside dioxygenase BX6-like isoform X1 [Phragmites australis]|uniref:DIBOA-glucoside dioxygenase BX6-like isoform X1 n=1 Tax=Phragmites australis TaxID=29695 RepID=UPI002D79E279|nr:DIBOA-glucoside dioxygenase BX6-like isoform X1 [Phragmites australis]XP_062213111.1 DIBOA-glucoside dioxygenase BX6-like isoform X1 [Phragmites australis]
MSTTTKAPGLASDGYDRRRELQAFDDTKAGVKGLVDAGITAVPAIFRHQQQQQQVTTSISSPSSVLSCSIPVIDLSVADEPRGRQEVVAQVKAASETAGFFQVVNHGVPGDLLSEMLASVKRFNEEAAEEKRPYYTRDTGRKVRFNSNFDLFQSPAANWRDTLFCEAAPEPPRLEELPVAVRHALLEYGAAARTLAVRVLELLSEALGLARDHLREMGCVEGLSVVSNYYPPCPEPHLTLGCSSHSDPSFLTVLLQDDDHAMGGLQVLLDHPAAGARWVDVPPLPGALLINIGDLLQLVSNGRFKSVEHRVVANKSRDTPRVSVACFCNADIARSTRLYGPIASDDPPVYRSVTVPEFLAHYDKKGLDGRPTLHYFQLPK